jgi:hypothetical protein
VLFFAAAANHETKNQYNFPCLEQQLESICVNYYYYSAAHIWSGESICGPKSHTCNSSSSSAANQIDL